MANKKSYKSQAKKAAKAAKRHPKVVIAVAIILVIIIAAVAILWLLKPEVFHKFLGTGDHTWSEWSITAQENCGKNGEKERKCTVCDKVETEVIPATGNHNFDGDVCTVCGYDRSSFTGDLEGVKTSELSIHFLELGNKSNGDCILIDCGEKEVLIDAGSTKSSAATISKYLDDYVDGDLDYLISTHSDEDHISALIGSKTGSTRSGILYQYKVGTLIKFDKAGTDGTGKPLTTASGNQTLYSEYLDAIEYAETTWHTTVFTASQCYEQKDGAQRQYFLDSENKISINILYNYYYYNASPDENNYSVVTLLTEEFENGKRNYLFTGDLEEDGESKMVDYYKSVPKDYINEYNVLPEVVLYKAGHHGSKTSSSEKLLKVIKPKYVAVCCCCGAPEYTTVNDNTFPTQQMINNIAKYTDKIYVTSIATGLPNKKENGDYVSQSYGGYESMNGNIVFYVKGEQLSLYCSNNDEILKNTEWFKANRTWPSDGV